MVIVTVLLVNNINSSKALVQSQGELIKTTEKNYSLIIKKLEEKGDRDLILEVVNEKIDSEMFKPIITKSINELKTSINQRSEEEIKLYFKESKDKLNRALAEVEKDALKIKQAKKNEEKDWLVNLDSLTESIRKDELLLSDSSKVKHAHEQARVLHTSIPLGLVTKYKSKVNDILFLTYSAYLTIGDPKSSVEEKEDRYNQLKTILSNPLIKKIPQLYDNIKLAITNLETNINRARIKTVIASLDIYLDGESQMFPDEAFSFEGSLKVPSDLKNEFERKVSDAIVMKRKQNLKSSLTTLKEKWESIKGQSENRIAFKFYSSRFQNEMLEAFYGSALIDDTYSKEIEKLSKEVELKIKENSSALMGQQKDEKEKDVKLYREWALKSLLAFENIIDESYIEKMVFNIRYRGNKNHGFNHLKSFSQFVEELSIQKEPDCWVFGCIKYFHNGKKIRYSDVEQKITDLFVINALSYYIFSIDKRYLDDTLAEKYSKLYVLGSNLAEDRVKLSKRSIATKRIGPLEIRQFQASKK